MKKTQAQQQMSGTTMYNVVFGSAWVKSAVWILFGFLLLQPIAPAFADEPEIVAESQEASVAESVDVEEEIAMGETEVVSEVTEVTDPTPEEPVVEVAVQEEVVDESTLAFENTASSTEEEQVPPSTDGDQEGEEASLPEATTTIPVIDDVEAQQDVESEVTEGEMTDDETEVVEESESQVSTSTGEIASTTDESVLVIDHNANQLQFNPDECASVGEGAFYCSTPKDTEEFVEDGVFAAPDADGDMEIFVRVQGEITQLTFNTIDDSAPSYDAQSDRIVWHANYNDRYQIMSYDMEKNEETKLTDTPYNNMEPVAYGDITMYQAWLDNNWEIILHDQSGARRLTTNTQHDVSPSIRSGYVVWQSQFADGWQVAVYHQDTNQIEYVKSEGGAKVENPRFVLVYDSTNEAGDVQTLGYDFGSKRSFTLNSIPADTPDELPEPDQTGETRALIQNKQSVRDSEIEEGEPTPTPNTASSTPSVSDNGIVDVDLTASSSTPASLASTTIAQIEDVVVPELVQASSTPVVTDIEDLVIPPTEATSTAEIR